MYLGRIEILPLGMFNDYSEADLERLATPGLSIGVGYAFAPNARETRVNQSGAPDDGGTTDYHSLAADVSFKYLGISLLAELFLRRGTRQRGDAVDDLGVAIPVEAARKGYGWYTQAGYLLPRLPIEVSARYGQVRSQGQSSIGDANEAGFGASYYFAGHPYKIQADAFRLWGDDFSDGTTRARVQVQLGF